MILDYELERTILGAMCAHEECLVNGMASIKKEYFDDKFHQQVYELLKSMYENGKHVSFLTVAQEGKEIFKKSGMSWLIIKETFVSSASFNELVEKLAELYKNRSNLKLAQDIMELVNNGVNSDEVMQHIEKQLYETAKETKLNVITPKKHAERMLNTLYERIEKKTNGGIKTSYGGLNLALNGGFEPGQLIIIAAKTGKGKTAFAMNLMRDITVMERFPGLYINTEMSEEQMDVRWMTILSGINHGDIASGNVDKQKESTIMKALDKMHSSGFHSVTEPNLTLNKLVSICRRFVAKKKCKFIVVDYIGRMETMDAKLQEWQVLKTAAKRLKTIAQELGVTVLMLAQVNDDERLEGARGMKNEADLYAHLRVMSDEETKANPGCNYALSIEKNRSGPTKKVALTFLGETLTFR